MYLNFKQGRQTESQASVSRPPCSPPATMPPFVFGGALSAVIATVSIAAVVVVGMGVAATLWCLASALLRAVSRRCGGGCGGGGGTYADEDHDADD